MYFLILTACLASDPQLCAARLLPAGAGDEAACTARGEATSADWLKAHPDLVGSGWRCESLDAVPKLELTEIGAGVLVHRGADEPLSPENRGGIANLGVVIGDDAVAVIDPGGSREQGEALFAAIRSQTDLPIGPVILTHMHPDHIAGAEVFAEAGGEVIGHANLPAELEARRDAWATSIPDQIGAGAWLGTALVPPTRVISEQTEIDLGGTMLTLTPEGPAHTTTDLTVYDMRSETLFTGDLAFRGLTPVVDGSLRGWLEWLAHTPAHGAKVVPGHGPLAGSLGEAVKDETTYLSALQDAVRAALQEGEGLSDAVPAIVAAMAAHAEGWADFEGTTARNAAAAYAEMEWD